MDWLHGILNLIGLLFWILWRAGTMPRPKPANVIAGPTPRQGTIFKHSWVYLMALVVLLILRAIFYNQFGPGLNWIPSLELLDEAPHFRSDFFPRALAYSVLSYARWLSSFYFCLALLITVKPDTDTAKMWRSFLRSQFGWLGGLSSTALWVAALFLAILLHIVEFEWMYRIGVRTGRDLSYEYVPLLIVLDFRAATYLVMGILTLYILNSFVYFGERSFWKNVDAAGKRLVSSICRFPLVVGKVDLAPFIVMGVAYGLSFALRHEQLAAWLR